MVKKSLKNYKYYTQEETNLCRITIYLLGSFIGDNVIYLLINNIIDGVLDFISQNVGTFTSSDSGVPIVYTA